MTHFVDIERLAEILREAAKAEIMPRFRNLSDADIREKTSATDLVTEADEAAERFIARECRALASGALFVGEESVAAEPGLLDQLDGVDLAIVVDPVDGTANFAAGVPLFAVMAAVVAKGETVGGIIYDPLGDDFMLAEKGGGAVRRTPSGETQPLRVAKPVALAEAVGCVNATHFPANEKAALLPRLGAVKIFGNYRCAGHEYRLLASGGTHFSLYSKLMPWDHLAGCLLVGEAGGHVAKANGSSYTPRDRGGLLIAACDSGLWRDARDGLLPV